MDIDIITQYILALVPAVTAIAGMITTLGIAISKIKKANHETTTKVEEVSQNDKFLKRQLTEVHRENVELKKQLVKLTARMDHLYFVDKDEKEE